jgi:hypothetical protein
MNTKLLMTASAVTMGATGILLSFLPHELLGYIDSTSTLMNALVLQVLGAMYFAFAMLNWTARANLIGGIYARPIAIGNLTHFVMSALALGKGYFSGAIIILPIALIYIAFAIAFTIVFFRHPVPVKSE